MRGLITNRSFIVITIALSSIALFSGCTVTTDTVNEVTTTTGNVAGEPSSIGEVSQLEEQDIVAVSASGDAVIIASATTTPATTKNAEVSVSVNEWRIPVQQVGATITAATGSVGEQSVVWVEQLKTGAFSTAYTVYEAEIREEGLQLPIQIHWSRDPLDQLQYSPDGRFISFWQESEVYVITRPANDDADDAQTATVNRLHADAVHAQWSPNADQPAMLIGSASDVAIVNLAADGEKAATVPVSLEPSIAATFDGSRTVLLVREREEAYELAQIDLTTSEATILLTTAEDEDTESEVGAVDPLNTISLELIESIELDVKGERLLIQQMTQVAETTAGVDQEVDEESDSKEDALTTSKIIIYTFDGKGTEVISVDAQTLGWYDGTQIFFSREATEDLSDGAAKTIFLHQLGRATNKKVVTDVLTPMRVHTPSPLSTTTTRN